MSQSQAMFLCVCFMCSSKGHASWLKSNIFQKRKYLEEKVKTEKSFENNVETVVQVRTDKMVLAIFFIRGMNLLIYKFRVKNFITIKLFLSM